MPFTAADPMEWVHCHIARKPVAACEAGGERSGRGLGIVMKLLAKTAEDRYQTAAGLAWICKDAWRTGKPPAASTRSLSGPHDRTQRLLIPEKLYGRDLEIRTLLQAFERVGRSHAGARPGLGLFRDRQVLARQ